MKLRRMTLSYKIYGDKINPKVKIVFEIPGAGEEGESRFVSTGNFTNFSTSEMAHFGQFLQRMLDVDSEDHVVSKLEGSLKETGNAYENVLGRAVSLKLKSGKYAQMAVLSSVNPLDPRIAAPESTEEPYIFEPSYKNAAEVFKTLSKFDQDRIMAALDFDSFPAAVQQAAAEALENRDDKIDDILG